MKVAPQSVSGRVVNTVMPSPVSVSKVTSAPSDLPIQFVCMATTRSGQSSPEKSRSSSA